MASVRVEVFSDVVCPWCYIGKRRLETAVANLAAKEVTIDLEVTYRPYQLDPTAPTPETTPVIDAYAKKFGGQQRAADYLESDAGVFELADELLLTTQNNITAVPTFIFDDRWVVPGAQDVAVFERTLVKLSEKL